MVKRATEGGVGPAPADTDHVDERAVLLRGRHRAAPPAPAREAAVDDEVRDPLGVARHVLDPERPALGEAEQRERVEARGVHHGLEVADPAVERDASSPTSRSESPQPRSS